MSGLPEELFTFVEVLTGDSDLRDWFGSFAETPEGLRARQFESLAARMQAGGEAPQLVRATALLARREVYNAVVAILRESGAN